MRNEKQQEADRKDTHIMKKETFVTKAQLEEIVKKYPTPFHLYDEAGIRKNAQAGSLCMEPGVPRVFCSKGDSKSIYFRHFKGL